MPAVSTTANPGPKRLVREAKILTDAGARIIPIGTDKRPLFRWRKYRTQEPTADEIRDWCVDPRTDGWAVLTGPVSGGWMGIDVEAPGMGYPVITDPFRPLPAACKRKSTHGGGHVHVKIHSAPADFDWSGQVIARVKSLTTGQPVLLAEVRGDGQYIVVTGRNRPLPEDFWPYEASPETFDALIAPGRTLHDPSTSQRKALSRATSAVAAAGVKRSPGGTGAVVRAAVLAEPDLWPLLLDPGWQVLGVYPRYEQVDGEWWTRVTLQRPGKNPADGESGNALGPVLHVFSTSVGWWPPNGDGLSPMQAVAEAHFAGDYHKACTEAETVARMLVLDGVLPDPAGPFGAWPADLLQDVHEARQRNASEIAHLTATGGMDPPVAQAPLPPEADPPDAKVLSMVPGGGQTAITDAEFIENRARDKLRDLLISDRAAEMRAEYKAKEADRLIEEAESRGENPLGWLTFDQDFWSADPSWTFLIPGLWPVGAPGAIFSGPGVGKSLIGLEWAACLATGQDVMGQPVDRRRVLYLDYENDPTLIRQRLGAMGFGPTDDLSWLTYSMLGNWPPLDTPAGAARLISEVTRLDVALVLIDTTARVISGEENSADTFNALFRHTVVPLKRAGVAVLRFDHTGKDAALGERGSSAKRGDVDLSYEMTVDDSGRYVTLTRRKNRPNLAPASEVTILERVTSPALRHLPTAPGTVTVTGAGGGAAGIAGPNPAVDAVVRYVRDHPGCGAHDIEKGLLAAGVKVGKARITEARHIAETLGRIRVENGPNKRKLHFPEVDSDITGFIQKVTPGDD